MQEFIEQMQIFYDFYFGCGCYKKDLKKKKA